jgi:hypothetical protein
MAGGEKGVRLGKSAAKEDGGCCAEGSWIWNALHPHLDEKGNPISEDSFVCPTIMKIMHSKEVALFLIFLLGMDVVLTLGEFIVQHAQCDYMLKHRDFTVKLEFVAAGAERRALNIPNPAPTSTRRSETHASSTTEVTSSYTLSHGCIGSVKGCAVTMNTTGNLTDYTTGTTMKVEAEVELAESHKLEDTEEAFAMTSMVIIYIFALEIVLLIIGMGPIKFFTNCFYVLDFTVITLTIVLHFLFHDQPADDLLILLRLWRFARILHGVYAATEEYHEEEEREEEEEEAEKKAAEKKLDIESGETRE